jgi:myo-inositol-1-phosphate synthase
MSKPVIGVWLIGARGGVATTVTLGLSALRQGLVDLAGLVTSTPQFAELDLIAWDQIALGGHEIRPGTLADAVDLLRRQTGAIDSRLIEACREDLATIDGRIRPGSDSNSTRRDAARGQRAAAGRFEKFSMPDRR